MKIFEDILFVFGIFKVMIKMGVVTLTLTKVNNE